jgi:hypothetical protein
MPPIDPNAPVNSIPPRPSSRRFVAKLAPVHPAQDPLRRGDTAWLVRHAWFGEACERLFENQAAVPLDG